MFSWGRANKDQFRSYVTSGAEKTDIPDFQEILGSKPTQGTGAGLQKSGRLGQAVVINYMSQALSGWGKNIGRGPWPFWPHSYPLLGATH